MLSIPIPDDLHYTNSHSLYVTVYGVNGASAFRNFPINGLSDNPDLVIDFSPVQPRPGEIMTVRINCDCSGNYMYWEWELPTGLDDEVITGNGWVDANEATFDIDLPFYLSGSVPLYVEVFDAEGNHVTSNEYINLEKMVELVMFRLCYCGFLIGD